VSHHNKEHAMALRPVRYRDAVIPHIYVDVAAEGIAFYARAFGARELFRSPGQTGESCTPNFRSKAPR
jgi:uncharacterized glyoxalase superfamily protein PhnB